MMMILDNTEVALGEESAEGGLLCFHACGQNPHFRFCHLSQSLKSQQCLVPTNLGDKSHQGLRAGPACGEDASTAHWARKLDQGDVFIFQ